MKPLLLTVFCLAFLGAGLGKTFAQAARGTVADVPTNFWAYPAIDTLTKAGVIVGGPDDYPHGTYSGSTRGLWPTRAKIAHALAFLLASLAPEGSPAERRRFLQERLRQSPDALASLEHLTDEFAPELKGLGQNVPTAKARLAALRRKPFPDLALKHWAYGAVEALRQEGIIGGFPQGRFTVP